jgi:selenocysteine-specific translation elongation factor
MAGVRVGEVTHYFNKISVAVIILTDTVSVGDTVHFLGRNVDFKQEVTSMQIEHQPIESAGAGQEVAMKVTGRARPKTALFKLDEEE